MFCDEQREGQWPSETSLQSFIRGYEHVWMGNDRAFGRNGCGHGRRDYGGECPRCVIRAR